MTRPFLLALCLFAPMLPAAAQQDLASEPRTSVNRQQAEQRIREEQERTFRDKVNEPANMGAKRPRLLRSVTPVYPRQLLQQLILGEVDATYIVNETGDVVDIRIERSSHELFSEAVIAALKQWKFQPFVENGVPQRQGIRQKFKFGREL